MPSQFRRRGRATLRTSLHHDDELIFLSGHPIPLKNHPIWVGWFFNLPVYRFRHRLDGQLLLNAVSRFWDGVAAVFGTGYSAYETEHSWATCGMSREDLSTSDGAFA